MDAFDYADTHKAAPPPRKVSGVVWNILTVLILLAVACIGLTFGYIFINPNAGLNPFPPPTDFPTIEPYVSPTPTLGGLLPPTWTPTAVIFEEPTATRTPRHTPTPFDTVGPTATINPDLTKTPGGGMSFMIQPGTPSAIPGAPFHPDAGCNWIGLAGYVYDLRGGQISSMEIHIGGALAGKAVEMVTLTGLLGNSLGAGYYEFTLGDKPVASTKSLWVQLMAQGGLPMSEKIYFDTYDSCDKNMILINFNQAK